MRKTVYACDTCGATIGEQKPKPVTLELCPGCTEDLRAPGREDLEQRDQRIATLEAELRDEQRKRERAEQEADGLRRRAADGLREGSMEKALMDVASNAKHQPLEV